MKNKIIFGANISPGDIFAGLSVALVLIPQSLAYSELAGMPAYAGLYTASLPLIVFGFFASSPYLQTGPTAVTGLLTFGALTGLNQEPHTYEYIKLAALLAIIVAGTRLLIGLSKIGWFVYLISQPVMRGFTTAAAILIISSQIPKALGITQDIDTGHTIGNALNAISKTNLWSYQAIILTVATIVSMIGLKKIHSLIPGAIVAAAIGILLVKLNIYTDSIVGDSTQIPSTLPRVNIDLPWSELGKILIPGLIIAIIGFAEASSVARTYAHEENQRWDENKEFFASGLANFVSAFTQGYPIGGSFSRSALNKASGAKTTLSGMITGLTVLAFIPLAKILTDLPQAVLAGIIIGAVYKLIDLKSIKKVIKYSKFESLLFFTTFFATLFLSPNIHFALLLGISVNLVLIIVNPLKIKVEQNKIILSGTQWYLSENKTISRINRNITKMKTNTVYLDLGQIVFMEQSLDEKIDTLIRNSDKRIEVIKNPSN